MAEYELVARNTNSPDLNASTLFGSRPEDKWVHRLADEAHLGCFVEKSYAPSYNIRLVFEHGTIDVIKHTPYKKD